MIICYHTTFQGNTERLLGFYHRMMNCESKHKSVKVFMQDIVLSYDQYQDNLRQVSLLFTIDYAKCDTHSTIFLILLDKLGLSEFKHHNHITTISKQTT